MASITIKQLAGTDAGDHHRRVEIPCQGQVWDSEQANVTTLPLLVISILIYVISTFHQYHSGQKRHQELSIQCEVDALVVVCIIPDPGHPHPGMPGSARVCIPKQEAFAAGNRLPHRCSDTATKIGPG